MLESAPPLSTLDHVTSPHGTRVSYARAGHGPPLVLLHGAFSDHDSNWTFVLPELSAHFTCYAIARRGRGTSSATTGHTIADEAEDAIAVIERLGEPVFLLGHSYGAHCALIVASRVPQLVRKLVLYEPARPDLLTADAMARLEHLAALGDWDAFATEFFRDTLAVPESEIDALRPTVHWPPILADAPATLHDLRAVHALDFDPDRYRTLPMPVLLQVGTESPRELYVTDVLRGVLPEAREDALVGQAHEGMTTAPDLYVASVRRFLLE